MAGFALSGLGFGWAMTGLSTVVQERAPVELRGRIMALWLVGFVGSRPIAAVLLGGTADLVSVQAAFAVAAALTAVVALWCRPSNLVGPLPLRGERRASVRHGHCMKGTVLGGRAAIAASLSGRTPANSLPCCAVHAGGGTMAEFSIPNSADPGNGCGADATVAARSTTPQGARRRLWASGQ